MKNNARYIIGFVVTVFLLIVLVVLLIGGNIGGGSSKKNTKTTTTMKQLQDYSNSGAVVKVTIDGPVNAQQVHDQINITVGRDTTVINRNSGYDGNVVKTMTYTNTETAYNVFLNSLNKVGFDKGDNNKALKDDRGFCPIGNRYVFEIIENGQSVQRYWATSCGGTKTYLGQLGLTLRLFRAQAPDYSAFISGTNI